MPGNDVEKRTRRGKMVARGSTFIQTDNYNPHIEEIYREIEQSRQKGKKREPATTQRADNSQSETTVAPTAGITALPIIQTLADEPHFKIIRRKETDQSEQRLLDVLTRYVRRAGKHVSHTDFWLYFGSFLGRENNIGKLKDMMWRLEITSKSTFNLKVGVQVAYQHSPTKIQGDFVIGADGQLFVTDIRRPLHQEISQELLERMIASLEKKMDIDDGMKLATSEESDTKSN